MKEEIAKVKTGQITYAVRDTSIDGVEIHKQDIMALGDSGILSVGNNVEDTAFESIKKLVDDDSELISIYFGEDIAQEDAPEIGKACGQRNTPCWMWS